MQHSIGSLASAIGRPLSTKTGPAPQPRSNGRKLGFEGSRLAYLLAGCGYFYQSHRAADDFKALIEIMSMKLNGSESTALAQLLESARKPTIRIWAEQSPFDLREILKKRKYRWNDGSDGRPKAWYVDVPEAR